MEPITIVLIILIIVGVWALVEMALMLRKMRDTMGELTTTVNEVVAEVEPVVNKLDGVLDEIQPATKQVEPLLLKVQDAVDAATHDLGHVSNILGDVSSVSANASNASAAVSNAAGKAANAATGLISKIGNRGSASKDSQLTQAEPAAQLERPAHARVEAAPARSVEGDEGYFTYPAPSSEPVEDTTDAVSPETTDAE
ncbi:MAG: hypothetical protein IJ125_06430 [Atopobiaceae bacterium]|nr:hypothetical protein [Atopobiaceae bacterium]